MHQDTPRSVYVCSLQFWRMVFPQFIDYNFNLINQESYFPARLRSCSIMSRVRRVQGHLGVSDSCAR